MQLGISLTLLLALVLVPLGKAAESPVVDVPGLPRVLLIGDSISMGYTLPVRTLLKGKANVHRPPTNCGATSVGLAGLTKWLGDKPWDVIHFNFGLHDAKLPPEGNRHSPPAVYEKNLRELAARLKATGAKLVWAATTPVPNGGVISPTRRFGSVEEYNRIAKKVMTEHGIAINDLNAAVAPRLPELQQPNDVHFTPAGSELLARHVAANIATQWAQQDPAAAGQWIQSLPAGPDRDPALSAYAANLAATDPANAARWAATISDPETRDQRLHNIARRWLRTDEPAALNWIQQSQLPATLKEKLLKK